MKNERMVSIVLGILFLTVMTTWTAGYAISGGILGSPDYLKNANPEKIKIFLGAVFEIIEITAVASIIAFLFPIIRSFSERTAVFYLVMRVIESVLLTIAVLCSLAFITLSESFLKQGANNSQLFVLIGTLIGAVKEKWIHTILPFFYSFAAISLYIFIIKTKLLPRVIPVIGIAAAVLVIIGTPLDFIGFKPAAFIGIFGGLFEIFLGIWLIAKGFNTKVLSLMKNKTNTN